MVDELLLYLVSLSSGVLSSVVMLDILAIEKGLLLIFSALYGR